MAAGTPRILARLMRTNLRGAFALCHIFALHGLLHAALGFRTRAFPITALDLPRVRNHRNLPCVAPTALDLTTSEHASRFSVLTWNLLADFHLQQGVSTGNYAGVAASDASWTTRAPRIVELLMGSAADVFALQEVELRHWSSDLLPALREAGYDGMVNHASPSPSLSDYKDHARAEIGVACAWQSSRVRPVWSRKLRRALLMEFEAVQQSGATEALPTSSQSVTPYRFIVVSLHLPGRRGDGLERVREARNVVDALDERIKDDGFNFDATCPVVLAGDLNSGWPGGGAATLLRQGALPKGFTERGYPIRPRVRGAGSMASGRHDSLTHRWRFENAFSRRRGPKGEAQGGLPTATAVSPSGVPSVVDHILFACPPCSSPKPQTSESLLKSPTEAGALRGLPRGSKRNRRSRARGQGRTNSVDLKVVRAEGGAGPETKNLGPLPNTEIPSDHFPLAAVFEIPLPLMRLPMLPRAGPANMCR
mmetsp:Transcript_62449/g.141191  ORF Transcript_62449/g.141191 Transcript_62449/m.141191 type:complete len:480 (-) Transcript_62449:182-1621(-)